jgi:hypothetical protein
MAQFVLKIDDKGFKAGFVDYKKAQALALTQTLSTQAALTRKNALRQIKSDMTLRNTHTARQIQFDKAKETSVTSQAFRAFAVVGATKKAGYMELQEEGGRKKTKRGGTSIAIGRPSARGGSTGQTISRQYYLNKMKNKTVKGSFAKNYRSRKARNVARYAVGFAKSKYVRSNNKIFEVTSFKGGGGSRPKIKMRLLYTLAHDPVRVPPSPWLEPSTRQPARDGFNIYKSRMKKLFRSGKII